MNEWKVKMKKENRVYDNQWLLLEFDDDDDDTIRCE